MHFADKIWELMLTRLYSEKTHTFYDYTLPDKIQKFEEYLPSPEIIDKQIPNPCGWGSGMEDGVINGSIMLENAIEAYKYTKDEKYISLAKDFFKGLKTLASVSSSDGFLARNVSPVDGKTHYIDSSRDQYTHWIYSCTKYYESGLADGDEKEFIKKTLCAFAKRARRTMTEETGFNLLREDEKKGFVVYMWGNIDAHEWMRICMFFISAWKICGDESFKDDYYRFRDEALERSEKICFSRLPKLFAIHQMQLSIRYVYDLDTDENFRQRCLALMEKTAEHCKSVVLDIKKKHEENDLLKGKLFETKPWNLLPANFWGFLDGYGYYVPQFTKGNFDSVDWHINNVGDGVATYLLCPTSKFDDSLLKAVELIGNSMDYENYYADSTSHLLYPYYKLMQMK